MGMYKFPPSPYLTANCLSRIFFCWLNKFLWKGYKGPLKITDFYHTVPSDKSARLGGRLEAAWNKEYTRYLDSLHTLEEEEREEGINLDGPPGVKKKKESGIYKPKLSKALVNVFWKKYALIGTLVLIEECIIKIAQPLSLGYMIRYYHNPDAYPDHFLYCTAGGIILTGILYNLTDHTLYFQLRRMGLKIRIACCSLLYRKALTLSQLSLQEASVGQVVNLLTNDVNRFDISPIHMHYLWVGPIQLCLVTGILWMYIGPCCFIGLGILVVFLPMQIFIGRAFSVLRQSTTERTDKRIRILSEILSGIRVLKYHAWETPFSKLVEADRKDEIRYIRTIANLRAIVQTFYLTASKVIIFVTLLVYVLTGSELKAELVFVTLSLFNNVGVNFTKNLPLGLAEIAETKVSVARFQEFLLLAERNVPSKPQSGPSPTGGSGADSIWPPNMPRIVLENVSAKWNPDQKEDTIKSFSMTVKPGQIVAIIGRVGSGKGSVLHTILRELPAHQGKVRVDGTVAYHAQEPWLFSGSVRENILFGKSFEQDWYDEVIEACALTHDLELLPYGDWTIVSDRGQTLSGGQKARITLARAVYANSDIILLDDPLSAVDASVGQHLFNNCINGILKEKARILITHQVQFMNKVDYVIIMENGKIQSEGTYKELTKKGVDFEELAEKIQPPPQPTAPPSLIPELLHYEEQLTLLHEELPPPSPTAISETSISSQLKRTASISTKGTKRVSLAIDPSLFEGDGSTRASFGRKGSIEIGRKGSLTIGRKGSLSADTRPPPIPVIMGADVNRRASVAVGRKSIVSEPPQQMAGDTNEVPRPSLLPQPKKKEKKYSKQPEENEEKQTIGGVKVSLYVQYFRAGANCCTLLFFLFICIFCQFLFTGSNYWLTIWTKKEDARRRKLPDLHANKSDWIFQLYNNRDVQIWGYTTIMGILIIVCSVRTILFFQICLKSSITLHKRMFHGIIRAPMKFFEENPAGRILNRFSKDMGQIDDNLPPTAFDTIAIFSNILGILVIISVVNPIMLAPAFVLCVILLFVRKLYIRTSRSVKRLESIAKSPVISHLATSLYGISSIRAYQAEKNLIHQFDAHQDVHTATCFLFLSCTRWFGIYLDWISLVFISVVTIIFVFTGHNGAEIGLVISSAMMMAGDFQWGVRQEAEVENYMVSTERVMEYANLTSEAALESTPDKKPPNDWPLTGQIKFDKICLHFGDHQVLTNVTFTAEASEKIGIVGRTGAGKSTLISVLFRLAEPTGALMIDGLDVTQIGLHDLRKKLSIIPQEPVLFSGSIRKNLDPFGNYPDDKIWEALEASHLAADVRHLAAGLDSPISEGGTNFSVGQRQLFCLGRAILRNNKILVLDEATANVDMETDHLIQKTMQTQFEACTVLTIAHRLHTVMDCDKMLVLDAGKVVEFDEPYVLLQNENGVLRSLVNQTGKETTAELIKQASVAHAKRLKAKGK